MGDDDLVYLANYYQSDKGTSVSTDHGYSLIYNEIFSRFKDDAFKMLEIGLRHPSKLSKFDFPSLQIWLQYFKKADVFGFDIGVFETPDNKRLKIFRGDQGNRYDLKQLLAHTTGKFFLIIDDGSHATHHQLISLGTLFPYLESGGLYLIEDLHFQPASIELPGLQKTRSVLEEIKARRTPKSPALSDSEMQYLVDSVDSVDFYPSIAQSDYDHSVSLAVIKKR